MISREFPPATHTGGIGSYTHKTSAALARLGHDVHVITAARLPAADYEENGVAVHRIQEPAERGPVPLSLTHTRAVAAAIARIPGELDIVQACEWNGEAFWYSATPHRGAKLVTRLATPHFVVEKLNDSTPPRALRRGVLTRSLERLQALRSDGIISPTRALAKVVCDSWRIAPDRVTIVPTGASFDLTASAASAPAPAIVRGLDYLFYFGRLEPRKGVHILGAALPRIFAAHPNLHAVFIGEDLSMDGRPMAEVVRELAAPYADRLIFLPRMPQSELFPFIPSARVVVLPSLWENLGNTTLETMQLGRPVVASWGSGFEEVVQDNISGFLAAPGDVESLGTRILDVLGDRENAERVGQAAIQRAHEFSVEAMAARLADYYQRLIQTDDSRKISA
jgi:glycosyltransferase involved in cell wall biosynthesis